MLLKGGNSVPDSVIPILIHLISATTSLHEYTVTALFDNIKQDLTNQPLNQVASWCIGEYADVLINKGSTADGKFFLKMMKYLQSLFNVQISNIQSSNIDMVFIEI